MSLITAQWKKQIHNLKTQDRFINIEKKLRGNKSEDVNSIRKIKLHLEQVGVGVGIAVDIWMVAHVVCFASDPHMM